MLNILSKVTRDERIRRPITRRQKSVPTHRTLRDRDDGISRQ